MLSDIKSIDRVRSLGSTVRALVANIASTPEATVTDEDVDWITRPVGAGSFCGPIHLEIRVPGKRELKNRLNEAQVLKLKADILDSPSFPVNLRAWAKEYKFISIIFTDPDGVSV